MSAILVMVWKLSLSPQRALRTLRKQVFTEGFEKFQETAY
jgi:hypothetical protein